MTDRELLELLVQKASGMEHRMESMERRMEGTEQKMVGMEQRMVGMEQRMGGMEQRIGGMEQRIGGVEQRVGGMEQNLQDIKASQIHIEQDHGAKITALFDGYTLHSAQIDRLQQHFDKRLDSIQNDLSYVVSKTAQHERKFIHIFKSANPRSFLPRK